MDGQDGELVQVAERLDRPRLLGHRVGPHHDLDPVVPEPSGRRERRRAVLGVHRGRGEPDARGHGRHCPTCSAPVQATAGDLRPGAASRPRDAGRPRPEPPHTLAGGRGSAGHAPHLGRVCRPGGRGPAVPVRPDLAHVELDVHLRERLPGHLRRPSGRRVLHTRRPLHRGRRLRAGRRRRGGARAGRVAVPRCRLPKRRAAQGQLDRAGGRRDEDQGRRRRLHLPQPSRLPQRDGLRAAPARGPAGSAADVAQARGLLAAADPAQLPHGRAGRPDELPRGDDHGVRPPRVGPRGPRPRLVLLGQPRGARRPGAGLPLQQGRARRAHGRGRLRGARRAL